jgi:hypothetical protein
VVSTRVVPHGGHSMPVYQPLEIEYWSKPDQIEGPAMLIRGQGTVAVLKHEDRPQPINARVAGPRK